MVGGEDGEVGLAQCGGQRLLDQADLQRERFQPAERAGGLGLLVDLVLEGRGESGVGRGDVEVHEGVSVVAESSGRSR